MALAQKYKVEWADMKALYDNLNKSRTKFSVNGESYPTIDPGNKVATPAKASAISDLKAAIEELKASHYVGDAATITDTMPNTGELLTPHDYTNQLNTIYNKCIYDASDFTFSVCTCVTFGFGACDCSFNPSENNPVNSPVNNPVNNPVNSPVNSPVFDSYLSGFNTFGFTGVNLSFTFSGNTSFNSPCHTFCTRQFGFSF